MLRVNSEIALPAVCPFVPTVKERYDFAGGLLSLLAQYSHAFRVSLFLFRDGRKGGKLFGDSRSTELTSIVHILL